MSDEKELMRSSMERRESTGRHGDGASSARSPWKNRRMRIYLPLADTDRFALETVAPGAASVRVRVEQGRLAWGVSAAARSERPSEDAEDLEYEAIQDAVYAALESSPASVTGARRVAVIAGDVSDGAVEDASAEAGAFGLRIVRAEDLRLASLHVTEQGADTVRADDTDPALLWFDVAEVPAALTYLREVAGL